jgi:hypothetical protein
VDSFWMSEDVSAGSEKKAPSSTLASPHSTFAAAYSPWYLHIASDNAIAQTPDVTLPPR